MAKKNSESQHQPNGLARLHPALKLRHTLRGHSGNVLTMALSPDGHTLASPSGSPDNTVLLWDVKSGQVLKSLKHKELVICVGWSPDGTTLATGTYYGHVFLWDTKTARQIFILKGHKKPLMNVAWSPDGNILASCSEDQTVRLWDAASMRALRTLMGHSDSVNSVISSSNSKRFYSGSWDKTVKMWNAETGGGRISEAVWAKC